MVKLEMTCDLCQEKTTYNNVPRDIEWGSLHSDVYMCINNSPIGQEVPYIDICSKCRETFIDVDAVEILRDFIKNKS